MKVGYLSSFTFWKIREGLIWNTSRASSFSVDGEIFYMPVVQSVALPCIPRSFSFTITFFDSTFCPDDRTHLGPFLVCLLDSLLSCWVNVGMGCGHELASRHSFSLYCTPLFFSVVVFRNAVSLFLLAFLHCSDNSSIISLLFPCSSTNQLLMQWKVCC